MEETRGGETGRRSERLSSAAGLHDDHGPDQTLIVPNGTGRPNGRKSDPRLAGERMTRRRTRRAKDPEISKFSSQKYAFCSISFRAQAYFSHKKPRIPPQIAKISRDCEPGNAVNPTLRRHWLPVRSAGAVWRDATAYIAFSPTTLRDTEGKRSELANTCRTIIASVLD